MSYTAVERQGITGWLQRKGFLQPQQWHVATGVEGVEWKVGREFVERAHFTFVFPRNHEHLIAKATELGIEPLSLNDIFRNRTLMERWTSLLLFDGNPRSKELMLFEENNWGIESIVTPESGPQMAQLRFCDFGGIRVYEVEPIALPFNVPFFTGVYLMDGHRVVQRYWSSGAASVLPKNEKRYSRYLTPVTIHHPQSI